jgi:pSer/pThr/pTyr-binding forkhead associated (FHA) protein
MNDKLTYFQRLSENAPNDFLRKLHTSNTEKIKTLQIEMLGVSSANNDDAKNRHTPASNNNYQQPAAQQPQPNASAAAWLVRHTENQSAKTFPLFYGKNFVGRANQPSNHTVVINDDPYVSRVHAILDVVAINPLQIVVCDEAATNGGKPSKNGTYINGDDRRLSKKITIRENDTLQIGMTKLIVRLNNTSIHKIVQEVEESDYMKTVVIDIF